MKHAQALTVQHASPLIALGQRFNVEPAKLMEVLRGTVIKPDKNGKQATNEEVAAFCIVAQQYGLNPFTREIHAFTSGDKGVVPIVGVDGWTHIVNGCDGFNGCEFEEVEASDGKPDKITCKMFVKGREHPVCATERFSECKRNTIPWQTMPFRMLRHKAYIQAARYAFGLSGIYDEDEARDITAQVEVKRPKSLIPAGADPADGLDLAGTVKENLQTMNKAVAEQVQAEVSPREPTEAPPDPGDEHAALLAEVEDLVDKAKAPKIKKVADATNWKWEDGEPLEALDDTKLKAIRSLLKC